MKYIIYLDNQQIDEFNSDEETAIKKFSELRDEYKSEEIYDEIRLFEIKCIKEENL